ncbi:MAG: HAMP domain-containing histidine kinase [Candidatus Fibromonas sp.]|jgi:signal transduction histidine kinase|nr:HAMP domain-containing histidine kinase [Candidatus Fibromonas sp.]
MVGRIASLAVPLRLLLFLAGILLATFVLAIIGFRSIGKEKLLAEKKYESARASLKAAIIESSQKETEAIVKEIQRFSFSENFLQDSLPGILSAFVFKDGVLIYPKIGEEKDSEFYLLEREDALALKKFLDLQKAKKFAEAREYVLETVNSFMKNPSIARLDWDSYFLEKMLNDILCDQNLSKEEAEKFRNILSETKRFLQNLDTYSRHRDFLLALGSYANYLNGGYSFIRHGQDFFLAVPSESTAKNSIIAKIDSVFYSNKMNWAISETAKEWSYIPYSISSEFPFGESNILTEENIIIEEDYKTVKEDESGFLLLMLVFSLIIPVIGVVVVYRGISRERQLRLMKDNFLSTISHELKTPLTSVKMYSELMNSGRVQKTEKIVSYTGVILKETNRLESLIEAILNYTRMESGKKAFRWESIDLSECVNKVCDSLDVIANGKGLEIKREIAAGCTITGDYSSIYSLVQNLVDNAIKYTAEGHVFVKLQQDAQSISFSVADTGKGIPKSEQKNIFEGFYRIGDESTRETKGSGLGLAIVKRTADAHKASIILESTPGKGSTFTVVFKRS